MLEYFAKPKAHHTKFKYFNPNREKKDWKSEFMKSLTYELTTVYADQLQRNENGKTILTPKITSQVPLQQLLREEKDA